MTHTTHIIQYPGHYLDGTSHDSEGAAVDRIAEALGWDDAIVSDSYTVDAPGCVTEAVSVYETQEECDADQDGAYAPRVVALPAD